MLIDNKPRNPHSDSYKKNGRIRQNQIEANKHKTLSFKHFLGKIFSIFYSTFYLYENFEAKTGDV